MKTTDNPTRSDAECTEPIEAYDDLSQPRATLEAISCDMYHYKQTLRGFYSNAAAILLIVVIGFALVISFDISIDSKVIWIKLLMVCGVVGIVAVMAQFVQSASKKR
jgi:hypothetical protein